jgi:GMP synthase-like glutamine amidotransferase
VRVLFIQHDHTSPPGLVGERFSDRGYGIEEFLVVPAHCFSDPGVIVDFPDPTTFDALVPMGASWSVYDTALIGSWVEPEPALLRQASEQGVPVLGLCFGGQLLAAAHGGQVVRAEIPEVGWHVVHTDDPELLAPGPWFQWHFDRWRTPPNAREIARNSAASQAFVAGRNLALQFHPELDEAMLTGWLDNGGASTLAERV